MSGKEYTKPNGRSSDKNRNRHFLNKKKNLTATAERLFMGATKKVCSWLIVFCYSLPLEYLPDRSYSNKETYTNADIKCPLPERVTFLTPRLILICYEFLPDTTLATCMEIKIQMNIFALYCYMFFFHFS